jgi:hypothetical protein
MHALMAVVLVVWTVPAASQSVDGRWQISIEPASRRTDDGGSVARRGFEGTLVLATDGPKVQGTLALAGGSVPELALSGTVEAGRLRVVTEWKEVEIAEDGRKSTMRFRFVLDGEMNGAVLAGSCRWEIAGYESVDQKWSATRSTTASRR